MTADYGPLPPLDSAWDLLELAEDRAPAEVRAVVDAPPVGHWVTRTLRRLRGLTHADTPLWVDLGYLHTLAAAAAVRADVDFVLAVPVRHRALVLPTVGVGNVATREVWAAVTLHHEGGRLRTVPGGPLCSDVTAESVVWRPTRMLRVTAGGLTLAVPLEDADPFRHIHAPARPARLTEGSARHWESSLAHAWKILVTHFPKDATVLGEAPILLAPMPNRGLFRLNSASSGDAVGAASLSEPSNAVWLAETLLHELAHARLSALLHLNELAENGNGRVGYAPWRDDPRPLRGMLHGIFAFTEITAFWRVWRTVTGAAARMHADFEFALARGQVAEALGQVRDHPDLTRTGHRFVAGLALRLESLLREPVAVEAGSLAGMARELHRIRWRLRHEGTGQGGDSLASARVGGPEIVPLTSLHGVTELCRLWLLDRADFLTRASRASDTRAGFLPADWRLVAGDLRRAREGYIEALATSPADDRARAGLAVCEVLLDGYPTARRDGADARPGAVLWGEVGDPSG